MLLAELVAGFPWGVLLITDASSSEPIPSWDSDADQVAVGDSALVVRVLHGDEGEATIRIWSTPEEAPGGLIYEGEIDIPSGTLRVSDALGSAVAEVATEAGRHPISIFADSTVEASALHIALDGGTHLLIAKS